MRTKFFHKLFGTYTVITIMAVLVAGFIIDRQIKTALTNWFKDDLMAQAQIMAVMPPKEIARQSFLLAERARARVKLIDAEGRIIIDSDRRLPDGENRLNRSEIQEARVRGQGTAIRYSQALRAETLYVALPLFEGDRFFGYISLSRSMLEVNKSIDKTRYAMLEVLLLVVLVSIVLAAVFSARIVSPIRDMAAFTNKIRMGDLSGIVMIESQDEVGQLAKNINEMVAELHKQIMQADEERRKLSAAFAGMVEGMIILDKRNRIESLNKSAAETIGTQYADLIGKTSLEIFRNVDLQDALNRFSQTGDPVSQEITISDDKSKILNVSISAVENIPGHEPKTMIVLHDVTRLKKLEQIRADFVANATHEIKTPLTAIIGFVETLQQGAINDGAKALKFLAVIHENAQRLNRLVDDLLTLSAIELGETKLHAEQTAPRDLLDRSLSLIMPKADLKNIIINTELPNDLPPISADRDKAVQILLNILDNAVKFTPEGGGVTITAAVMEPGFVTLKIADTGPGIGKSELPRLGERFYRVDRMRSRDMGGTGLGLSIVKHLMRIHQGRMEIESIPGKGTQVSVVFPIFRQPDVK